MRARQDALTAGVVALSLAVTGCGAIFHSSQKVSFDTRPENAAVVYRYHAPLSTPPSTKPDPSPPSATIFLSDTSGFTATAPGKKIAVAEPHRYADGVVIALDVLWCVTIVGIAAPIADGLLGTFSKTDERVEVRFEDDPEGANPLPVYSIEGATFTSAEAPPEAAPPEVAPRETAPPPTTPVSEPTPPQQ